MNIKELIKIHSKGLINFVKLAEEAGINYQTLMAKISRGSELKVNEAEAIENALNKLVGLKT